MIAAGDVAGIVELAHRVEAVDRPGRQIASAGAGAAIIAEDERRGARHDITDRLGQFGFRHFCPRVGAGRNENQRQDGKNGSHFFRASFLNDSPPTACPWPATTCLMPHWPVLWQGKGGGHHLTVL